MLLNLATPQKNIIRAFRTIWDGTEFIVFTSSYGKARYACECAAKEAGYRPFFIDITVYRAKEFDNKRMVFGGGHIKEGRCYVPSYLYENKLGTTEGRY